MLIGGRLCVQDTPSEDLLQAGMILPGLMVVRILCIGWAGKGTCCYEMETRVGCRSKEGFDHIRECIRDECGSGGNFCEECDCKGARF